MSDLRELLQVVDQEDNPIGSATKAEVWKGLLHRTSGVLVFNKAGELLIQKRSNKLLFPFCYDISVSGHVKSGEGYLEAALRETREEIGIEDAELTELGGYYAEAEFDTSPNPVGLIVLRKFVKAYRLDIDYTPRELEKNEVDSVSWESIDWVKGMVNAHPDKVTDSLLEFSRRYI